MVEVEFLTVEEVLLLDVNEAAYSNMLGFCFGENQQVFAVVKFKRIEYWDHFVLETSIYQTKPSQSPT